MDFVVVDNSYSGFIFILKFILKTPGLGQSIYIMRANVFAR